MENTLPKNWVETNLKNISEIVRGVSYKKDQALSDYFDSSKYILRGGNIQNGKIDFDTNDNVYVDSSLINEIQEIKKDDVVIVGSTGSKKLIGKAGIADEDLNDVSFGAFLMLLRTSKINTRYHSYFFQTKYYRNSISELAGGVNINNIRKEHLENLKFPLPPLPEQERIVAKLDALFAQHEKMKQSLSRIPQLLKDFRQQVLTKAVTGKLTEEWRKGKELEDWKDEKLENLSSKIGDGLHGTPKYTENSDYYFINGNNLVDGIIQFKDSTRTVSFDEFQKHKKSLGEKTVLLSINGTLGNVAFYNDEKVILGKSACYVNVDDNLLLKKYLKIIYNSEDFLNYAEENATGTTIKNLGLKAIRNFLISLPSLPEQQEIVSRVESLFAKADAIENRYHKLKATLDLLPQTILHKAFKGELVPQLPTDGDARDLLAEIVKLKADQKTKPRK